MVNPKDTYDKAYSETADLFGRNHERCLESHLDLISRDKPVLDIGTGQGRNAFFLARHGFKIHGIDTSKISVDTVNKEAEGLSLDIKAVQSGFQGYSGKKEGYSAILVFGLIQILTWEEIHNLLENLKFWISNYGVIFITAFSTLDPAFDKNSKERVCLGKNSYQLRDSGVRTYLKPGEILELFKGYTPVHHREWLGPYHRHGDADPERHNLIEAVFQKTSRGGK